MTKKIITFISLLIVLVLIVGCGGKSEQTQVPKEVPSTVPQETAPASVPVTEPSEVDETSIQTIDEVGEGISTIVEIDDELAATELDDLDDILSDIENI